MDLTDYIQLPRKQRQAHVNLSTPCILKGSSETRRKRARKVLLNLLGVENDIPNWKTQRVQICHSCECHSRNGWCENPLHLSIGSTKENAFDKPLEVRHSSAQEGGKKGGRRSAELEVGAHDPAVRLTTHRNQRKTIEVTSISTGQVQHFEGVRVAAKSLGIHPSSLGEVCQGKRKTVQGYTARYA